ncbi:hypothetical protein D3C86_1429600 [compost metagenome]
MHHFPVKGAGLADNHKIRIHIGDGKACFIKLVDQRAFPDHVRFFAFLTFQEVGGRHRGGVKHAVRHVDARGGKAVGQILPGLRRIVGQQNQRHSFFQNTVQKLSGTGHRNVIVHQHAVNITNHILNGHELPGISKKEGVTIKRS